jgi:flagellar L-ring protein precursor FlgH
MSMPNLLGLEASADRILPPNTSLSPAIQTSSSTATNGAGTTRRNERLTLRVAATVIAVLPNGHLVVEGSQEVRVNFEARDLAVAGVVRPEDISRRNEITYDKIASARIAYGGRGQLTILQQPRWGQQITEQIAPF